MNTKQSIIGATSSNDREEIQSSEPVGEDNHVDRMHQHDKYPNHQRKQFFGQKGDEPIYEMKFETPRSDEIKEENIIEMPREKGKLSLLIL